MAARLTALPALGLLLAAVTVFAAAPVRATPDDGPVIELLERATVVESADLGAGVSGARKLLLEYAGRHANAVFKTIDRYESGISRDETGFRKNFDDSYRYERAAYLLDRYLGLRRVPVVVLREWEGRRGAVIEWIPDAISEERRRELRLSPPDPRAFEIERSHMRLFDALIANEDRNLGNQLITTHDWKLHLIDHTRSFRLQDDLPRAFVGNPARVTREMYERLLAMDRPAMESLLDGLVSKPRIRTMLERRDRIVAKIEADLARYGAAVVFLATEADPSG